MLLRCWDLWYRSLRYMLLRCWDLWDRLLRYIHVATLLRSLVSFTTLHVATLLRSLGSFTTLHVATLLRISGIVYYVTYMLLRCWDLWDLWELGNGDAFTRMLTASCLLRMRCSDDAEKRKKRASSFSRISNHQISTALLEKSPFF